MQTVDHLLALEMGRDSGEIVDRTGSLSTREYLGSAWIASVPLR